MSKRWTVYLRHGPEGWEWSKTPDNAAPWWGYYKTVGRARGAARRSITPVVGGKTNRDDFEFIVQEVRA